MKKLISAALAAIMLLTSGAVNTFAYSGYTNEEAVGYVYSVGGLKTPKIVRCSKGSNYVRFTWEIVKGVSGYKVYRKTSSGKYKCIKTIRCGVVTTCIVDGLDSHTRYVFKVRAYKKSGKKIKYSKYSPGKALTTKYGVGAGNYSCKQFNIKFDKDICDFSNDLWKEGEFGSFKDGINRVEFGLKGYDRENGLGEMYYCAGGWIDVDKISKEEKGRSLKYFAEKYKKEHDDPDDKGETLDGYQNKYYIEYGKKFGVKCAYIYNIGEWDELTNGTLPMIMICKNGYLYTMRCFYGHALREADRDILSAVLDNLVLT